MKKLILGVLISLVVVSFSFAAALEPPSSPSRPPSYVPNPILPVYDDNGKRVSSKIASAEGLKPAYNVGGANIRISAEIKNETFGVTLSATDIRWNINAPGNYMTPAIKITKRGFITSQGFIMEVKGADNLKPAFRPANGIVPAGEIPTSYCLKSGTLRTGVVFRPPKPREFIPAKQFNGSHIIKASTVTLWNRLSVKPIVIPKPQPASSKSIPIPPYSGKYDNVFTVTFSSTL